MKVNLLLVSLMLFCVGIWLQVVADHEAEKQRRLDSEVALAKYDALITAINRGEFPKGVNVGLHGFAISSTFKPEER